MYGAEVWGWREQGLLEDVQTRYWKWVLGWATETPGYVVREEVKVDAIFRHGDRTPDSLYPNDPYTEEDFYPYRIAHLTNKGKLTSYNLGTYLRRKYNNLLGDVYTPDILSAISSHLPRTKASLQAVLAGLYPPSEELIWEKNLLWEPIPYDYLPAKENILFSSVRICPNGLKLLNENYIKLDSDPIYQKYNYLYPFLLENSGLNDNFYNVARFLFSTLKSEEDLGMELPKWTKRTYSTINGVNEAKNKKIYLYSGHDENVAAILYFLDNFIAHIPNYGAHIIIEVHKFSGIYFLKCGSRAVWLLVRLCSLLHYLICSEAAFQAASPRCPACTGVASGKVPSLRHALYMCSMTSGNVVTATLRASEGIPSGPGAFLFFIAAQALTNSSSVKGGASFVLSRDVKFCLGWFGKSALTMGNIISASNTTGAEA
nr:venom acid phosphatase Acph-1-like [Onthophagus taurus]